MPPTRLAALLLALLAPPARADDRPPVLAPAPALETEPVPSGGDAADDPAIWVHPADPARSLVLGTDKKGGLNVFDMDGKRLGVVGDGVEPNNVDVLYDFPIGAARVDLAVAGTRAPGRMGVAIWRIDPGSRTLTPVGPLPAFPVLGGGEPYGSCTYRSPRDGASYVFASNKDGVVEQHRIEADPAGAIRATLVRTLRVGSQVEGMVADPDLGHLYVGEEDVAIWKYAAEPDGGAERVSVARVGEHGIAADVEGLALYCGPAGRGYLIASSQGNHTFAVFERAGVNPFVATIDPAAGPLGDLGETDGVDATAAPTSARFSHGFLVAQDGRAAHGRQNFKLFDWRDVAAGRLRVDPPRPVRAK